MAQALRLPEASAPACPVCGCESLRTDVVDPGSGLAALLLAECTRCDHRFTEAYAERRAAIAARPSLRVLREGASAA